MSSPLSGYITSGIGTPLGAGPPSALNTNSTLLHGYFNSSHESWLYIYYPPGCIGIHSAFASWKDAPPSKFAIARTTICFALAAIRSIVAFIIALKATLNSNSNHPSPSSLLLVLGSLQTYVGSRNIPLICNFLLVVFQILVYAALVLAMQSGAYGRFAIGDGNCPPRDRLNYATPAFVSSSSCVNASRSWRAAGCQTIPSPSDPNDSANKIARAEEVIAYIGGVYVLTIIIALFDTISFRRSSLFQLVKRDTTKRLKFAVWFAVFSLILSLVLIPIVVSAHYNQLKRPQVLTFVDSWGNYERINRTFAASRQATTFDFGDVNH